LPAPLRPPLPLSSGSFQRSRSRSRDCRQGTVRWRTSRDVDKEVDMKMGRPLSLVFWLTQKGTYQLGLMIDPKSDSSVSKVVQQNRRVTPQCPK
jgi:hypothetical protein